MATTLSEGVSWLSAACVFTTSESIEPVVIGGDVEIGEAHASREV
jgi:hypothetical protein